MLYADSSLRVLKTNAGNYMVLKRGKTEPTCGSHSTLPILFPYVIPHSCPPSPSLLPDLLSFVLVPSRLPHLRLPHLAVCS